MKELSTYLLLMMGGNAAPTADDVTAALAEVGVTADADALGKLLGEIAGKDIAEIIEMGKDRLAGGGGGGAAAGPAAAAGGDAGAAAEEAEPEKEEEPEEVDLGGGMDMFGGGDADY
uniref:50S ribosomal protein L12 n=2 Tax=Phaeomonas parva TaxID=124430 RepID=A0A7S1U1W4_9STRA|mmetsp:Transcript_27706/g.87906  ORF Transcript_27706/g.87906 Transcript_27706/m.87906 type:complete len:117 (+) Transcript_27706:171-521(+)